MRWPCMHLGHGGGHAGANFEVNFLHSITRDDLERASSSTYIATVYGTRTVMKGSLSANKIHFDRLDLSIIRLGSSRVEVKRKSRTNDQSTSSGSVPHIC